MTYSIKLLFIPCEANQFRPYFIGSKFLAWIILALFIIKMVLVSFTVYFPQTSLFAAINKSTIISLANQDRQSLGLGTLRESSKLNNAAYFKAKDMLKNDYFAHTSPSGISPWYWFSSADYDYNYAGENLAMDFIDSTELYYAWYNSPSHKANLVGPNFEETGIAIVTGEFKGRETTIVVQLFGSKTESVATASKKPKEIQTTVAPAKTITKALTQETTTIEEPSETYHPENEGSLYAYYTKKGEKFPSFEDRANLFEKYGLGLVSKYQGTVKQNDMLLGELLGAYKNKNDDNGTKKENKKNKPEEKKQDEEKLTNLEEKLTEKEIALLEENLSMESQEPVFSSYSEIKGVQAVKESGFWFYTASIMTNHYDNITQKIFLAVFLMVILSLALDIFIKIKHQSKDLISRGVFYSFVLFSLFLLDKEIIVEFIPHNLGIL